MNPSPEVVEMEDLVFQPVPLEPSEEAFLDVQLHLENGRLKRRLSVSFVLIALLAVLVAGLGEILFSFFELI